VGAFVVASLLDALHCVRRIFAVEERAPQVDAEDLSGKLDLAWGDPQAWTANGLQWLHLPAVQSMVRRRVTGNPDLAPLDWFFAHVMRDSGGPFARVLVLGCGFARIERLVIERGWAAHVVAMDFSAKIIAAAREEAKATPEICYTHADMDCLPVGQAPFEPGSFDVVLGVSSVHHCAKLAELYEGLHRLLKPGGWMFLDEYVGPSRFQYPESQLQLVRRFSSLLPVRLRTTRSGAPREGLRAPTVEEVIAVDPSEAACSADILALLPGWFDIERLRPYGGALLHLLFAQVAQNFLDPAEEHTVRALIEAEEELYREGRLSHDFACVIARARRDIGA